MRINPHTGGIILFRKEEKANAVSGRCHRRVRGGTWVRARFSRRWPNVPCRAATVSPSPASPRGGPHARTAGDLPSLRDTVTAWHGEGVPDLPRQGTRVPEPTLAVSPGLEEKRCRPPCTVATLSTIEMTRFLGN